MCSEHHAPKVSVIVPAFNVGEYIAETLQSLQAQSLKDFEVLVIDDGSTDDTAGVARAIALEDARIKVVSHEVNCGPAAARNTGLRQARGGFIALLDADDIALSGRLKAQVNALEADPSLGMIGSQVEPFDSDSGVVCGRWERPTDPAKAGIGLVFRNTLSAVMTIRREAVPSEGFVLPLAEDYDVNVKVASAWRVTNHHDVLSRIRVRKTGLTHTRGDAMEACVRSVIARQLEGLDIVYTDRELIVHRHLGGQRLQPSMGLLDEVESWLHKLVEANDRQDRYDKVLFRSIVGAEWLSACSGASQLGIQAVRRYSQSSLVRDRKGSLGEILRFMAKASIRHRTRERV